MSGIHGKWDILDKQRKQNKKTKKEHKETLFIRIIVLFLSTTLIEFFLVIVSRSPLKKIIGMTFVKLRASYHISEFTMLNYNLAYFIIWIDILPFRIIDFNMNHLVIYWQRSNEHSEYSISINDRWIADKCCLSSFYCLLSH